MSKALEKLRQIFGGGIYNPSTNVFAELNLDALAAEIEIDREATLRGKKNVPSSDAKDLDDIEVKIVASLEAQRSKAHQNLNEQFRTYDERLSKYDSIGYPSKIQTTAIEACGDLYVEVRRGLDALYDLRKQLIGEEVSLDRFRRQHRRLEPAHYPDSKIFHIAFVLLLLLVESFANGKFLAQGDEGGLVGGVTIALGIAAANVGLGFFVGYKLLPWIAHRSASGKLFGGVMLILYVALMLVINFGAAHYRDAVLQVANGSDLDPASAALVTLKADPFGVADLKSWLMLGMGLAFSVMSAYDGWKFDEPYPGYGARWRRVSQLRADYASEKERLERMLEQTKDEAVEAMEEAIKDLTRRSEEIRAIGSARRNLLALCAQHLTYLQDCANQLATRYREKNKQFRAAPAPDYWQRRISLAPIALPVVGNEDDKAWQRFDRERRKAQEALVGKTEELMGEYRSAIDRYHTIEQLTPEGGQRETFDRDEVDRVA